MTTLPRSPLVAGLAAGSGLAAALAALRHRQLAPVEWMAIGVSIVGLALSWRSWQDATDFWYIAAISGIPPVVLWWAVRNANEQSLLHELRNTIANRDYRAEATHRS